MAVTASETITKGQALAQLKAGRAPEEQPAQSVKGAPANSVSDAARTLGQRAAEKRALNASSALTQPPAGDKVVRTMAPAGDKPDDEPEENDEAQDGAESPEGQDATEEQSQDGEKDATDDDGSTTIVIDGERLTKQEIRDSYLRREDYSRKTAELADQRRHIDTVMGTVTQSSQRLNQLVGMLENAVGQEPDWSTLAMQMQPQQYLSYKEQWTQQKNALNNVRAEAERNSKATIQQAKAAMFDEFSRTTKPEWQDRTKMQEGITKLADFAVSMGITGEELQMLHRTPMLRILDMAHELHSMKQGQRIQDKRVVNKPKPLKPGTRGTRPSANAAQFEAEKQAWESNKNPKPKDAMRWLNAKRAYEASTGRRES